MYITNVTKQNKNYVLALIFFEAMLKTISVDDTMQNISVSTVFFVDRRKKSPTTVRRFIISLYLYNYIIRIRR